MNHQLSEYDIELDTPIEIGGLVVTIGHDADSENPWDCWDCMTPLVWTSGNRKGRFEVADSGDGILTPLDDVSPAWTSRHWRALCKVFDIDSNEFDSDSREWSRDYGDSLGQSRLDLLRKHLSRLEFESVASIDYFDVIASIWNLRGASTLVFQRNGYSQGDSIWGILAVTPEHVKRCGSNVDTLTRGLKSDADLLAQWAFGDVYWFDISDTAGNSLDSCGGFYGLGSVVEVINESLVRLVNPVD